MSDQGLMLVISGPSGVGKTTITHHVEKQLDAQFSVSLTTRPQREGDTEGVDYCFVSLEEFAQQRDAGELLEYAEVFGNWYGTPRAPMDAALAKGRVSILEIDVEGAVQIKEKVPQAFSMFVLPPSEQALLNRLRARATDEESVIQRRFAKAKAEIIRAWESGIYDYFIVNDDLDEATAKAVSVVRNQWQQRQS